ncbi:hypothetical protein D3C76_1583220 [compost metagenome]
MDRQIRRCVELYARAVGERGRFLIDAVALGIVVAAVHPGGVAVCFHASNAAQRIQGNEFIKAIRRACHQGVIFHFDVIFNGVGSEIIMLVLIAAHIGK